MTKIQRKKYVFEYLMISYFEILCKVKKVKPSMILLNIFRSFLLSKPDTDLQSVGVSENKIFPQRPNLMNLSHVSNPTKTGFN